MMNLLFIFVISFSCVDSLRRPEPMKASPDKANYKISTGLAQRWQASMDQSPPLPSSVAESIQHINETLFRESAISHKGSGCWGTCKDGPSTVNNPCYFSPDINDYVTYTANGRDCGWGEDDLPGAGEVSGTPNQKCAASASFRAESLATYGDQYFLDVNKCDIGSTCSGYPVVCCQDSDCTGGGKCCKTRHNHAQTNFQNEVDICIGFACADSCTANYNCNGDYLSDFSPWDYVSDPGDLKDGSVPPGGTYYDGDDGPDGGP